MLDLRLSHNLNNHINRYITKLWYQPALHPLLWGFIPFSALMLGISKIRRFILQQLFAQEKYNVPVIVVGNLTVGGTGKTPLVLHIAHFLQTKGLRVGIVLRGYKGNYQGLCAVTKDSTVAQVGDEAFLLAQNIDCPIVVSKNRHTAVQSLIRSGKVEVIISDDGLQHYGMDRFIEIVMVDGRKYFGNGWCLPAGPLREDVKRIDSVDYVVVNNATADHQFKIKHYLDSKKNRVDLSLKIVHVYNGKNPQLQKKITEFVGKKVHAVAGIGQPENFFALLERNGVQIIPHAFPDHYCFHEKDLCFKEEMPVLMTEKDAVKMRSFLQENHWVVKVAVDINPLFLAQLYSRVQSKVVENGIKDRSVSDTKREQQYG